MSSSGRTLHSDQDVFHLFDEGGKRFAKAKEIALIGYAVVQSEWRDS